MLSNSHSSVALNRVFIGTVQDKCEFSLFLFTGFFFLLRYFLFLFAYEEALL